MTSNIDIASIDRHLTPARLRVAQVIYVGLASGMMTLLVIILFFYSMGSDSFRAETSSEQIEILSIVTGALWVMSLVVGGLIYRSILDPKQIDGGAIQAPNENASGEIARWEDAAAVKCISLAQRATILRAIFADVPATFGSVVCIMAITDGILFTRPEYLLNILPAFFLLAFIALTFPTKERMMGVIQEKLLGHRR